MLNCIDDNSQLTYFFQFYSTTHSSVRMHFTLLSLLSLAGTALASHHICYMRGKGYIGDYARVALIDDSGELINQSKAAAQGDRMDTFEHIRGSVSVNHKLQIWGAKIHGQEWDLYPLVSYHKLDKERTVWFGCYDTSNNGYCKEKDAMYKRCVVYIT